MSRKKKQSWGVRKSVRHDYLTPSDFIEILLRHLGRTEFDLDVCCSLDNIPAKQRFTEVDDAFNHDWKGVCWMNPPCGDMLQKFCGRMVSEVERLGSEFWVLLPSRFPEFYVTQFQQMIKGTPGLLKQASLVYVMPDWTFQFGLPGKKITKKAKSSWWLCHFGGNPEQTLTRFREADPFKGTKYEGVLLCPAR